MHGLVGSFGSAIALAALFAACGGSTQPPTPATGAGAGPAGSAAPASGEKAVEAPEEEPTIPRAKIIQVLPGKDSPDDRRVKIRFDNPTSSSCTFTSYTLVWPSGRKTIEEKPFEIPPGGKRERVLIMHPNDGDLGKLKVEGSDIEVNAGCAKL